MYISFITFDRKNKKSFFMLLGGSGNKIENINKKFNFFYVFLREVTQYLYFYFLAMMHIHPFCCSCVARNRDFSLLRDKYMTDICKIKKKKYVILTSSKFKLLFL